MNRNGESVPRKPHFQFPVRLVLIAFLVLAASGCLTIRRAAADTLDQTPKFEWADGTVPDETASEPSFAVETRERTPASAQKTRPVKKGKVVARSARKSRLPAAVSDGFEIKLQYQKETSMFWVVKRESKFDLLYATSGGSRSSVSLSPEIFRQLLGQAQAFKPIEADLHRCKDASIQLSVVATDKPERQIFSCVMAKGAEADRLRNLSQSLAMIVK